MRRRLWFWRVVAAVAIAVIAYAGLRGPAGPSGPHIVRHAVLGLIADDPDRDRMFERIAEDDRVSALILRINSPGGTTVGAEALYESIRLVSARKPVVAIMGEAAASGGYIAAIAADRVIARGNTITASIGVIAQYPDVSRLLDTVGVTMREVKSSPLKAAPSPFAPPSEAALEVERAMVADSYAWFRALVAERRGLSGAALDRVSDGRVMTGRQALDQGLVDAIGGEREARAWLETQGIESGLEVVDVEAEREKPSLLDLIASTLGGDAGGALARLASGPRLASILR